MKRFIILTLGILFTLNTFAISITVNGKVSSKGKSLA